MKNLHKGNRVCPRCGKLLIDPLGDPHSPYLLVGDFPGFREAAQGKPFAFRDPKNPRDSIRSGDILRDELTRAGVMLNSVCITNLWQHQKFYKTEIIQPKTSKGKPKEVKVEACPMQWHLDDLVRSITGRTHVLLMGPEVVHTLTGHKIEAVSGTRVTVDGVKGVHIWAAPSPALAFMQPIGELRLAFQRFAEDVNSKKRKVKTK